ncbi:Alg9-like mannosyltransferase family-domain-containing protein [Trichophaea hybrida]|nr:Alg9-like mannosyltransferase family-domain-containing protein [Trichophaea hybrida]
MWRRVYLLLLAVRLYFALSPSYLHPDEHFQGPEVIAGHVFNWATHKTWEFTSEAPIRSYFPLWLVYGLPLKFLNTIIMPGPEPPRPVVVFYFWRILFFLLSFVLEDWALLELTTPHQKRLSLALLASSYVTWTYQTHTFSNSIETIAVLWSLVLIEWISASKTTAWLTSSLLGFIVIFGIFNRITFPAFLILPAFRLLQPLLRNPLNIVPLILSALLTFALAIYIDTTHYTSVASLSNAVITPLNNLLYNSNTSNLALHGLHPWWTHLFVNIPQLLGPFVLLHPLKPLFIPTEKLTTTPALSALGGIFILSILPHQEARFLLPVVPLLLASATLPLGRWRNVFITLWVLFNTVAGIFFGMYHQAGVVPAQVFLSTTNATDVVNTTNLMGAPVTMLLSALEKGADCGGEKEGYLAAPLSATNLDPLLDASELPFHLDMVWSTRRHLNMDRLGFGDNGVVDTAKRVIGRRGLGVWRIRRRECGV